MPNCPAPVPATVAPCVSVILPPVEYALSNPLVSPTRLPLVLSVMSPLAFNRIDPSFVPAPALDTSIVACNSTFPLSFNTLTAPPSPPLPPVAVMSLPSVMSPDDAFV